MLEISNLKKIYCSIGLDTDFHNWDVLFPAITICDRNPNDPESVDGFINKYVQIELYSFFKFVFNFLYFEERGQMPPEKIEQNMKNSYNSYRQ